MHFHYGFSHNKKMPPISPAGSGGGQNQAVLGYLALVLPQKNKKKEVGKNRAPRYLLVKKIHPGRPVPS